MRCGLNSAHAHKVTRIFDSAWIGIGIWFEDSRMEMRMQWPVIRWGIVSGDVLDGRLPEVSFPPA